MACAIEFGGTSLCRAREALSQSFPSSFCAHRGSLLESGHVWAKRISPIASPLTFVPVREIGMVALLALAVYVLLAIGSYSPLDPAWTFAGSGLTVSNLVGRVGALIADVALLAFGWAAYLLPAGLGVSSVLLFRTRGSREWSWASALVRCGGFVAVVVSTCLLLRLHVEAGQPLPAGPGGAIGDGIARAGLPLLNWVGLTVCALAVLAIGSQAALGLFVARRARQDRSGGARDGNRAGIHVDWCSCPCRAESASNFREADRIAVASSVARGPRHRSNASPSQLGDRRSEPSVEASKRRVKPKVEVPAKPTEAGFQGRLFDLKTPFELPGLELLEDQEADATGGFSRDSLDAMSRLLEKKLDDFGVDAEVRSVLPGPCGDTLRTGAGRWRKS